MDDCSYSDTLETGSRTVVASSNALAQGLLQVGVLGKPTEIKIRSECSSQFARWTDSSHSLIVQLTVRSYQYVR